LFEIRKVINKFAQVELFTSWIDLEQVK